MIIKSGWFKVVIEKERGNNLTKLASFYPRNVLCSVLENKILKIVCKFLLFRYFSPIGKWCGSSLEQTWYPITGQRIL